MAVTVISSSRATPPSIVRKAVSIPFFPQFLDEDGTFQGNAELEAGGKAMLDELLRLTTALRTLRAA